MDATLGVLDIKERDLSDIPPPSFPTPSAPTTPSGFPPHKKRVSAFKQQRQGRSTAPSAPAAAAHSPPSGSRPAGPTSQDGARAQTGAAMDERRAIDEENKALLESMSPEEIAQAQRELYANLDSKFIQTLLKRANIDERTGPSPFDTAPAGSSPTSNDPPPPAKPRQATVEDAPEEAQAPAKAEASPPPETSEPDRQEKPKKTVTFDEDAPPPTPPPDLFPATKLRRPRLADPIGPKQPNDGESKNDNNNKNNRPDRPHKTSTHFPKPPAVPDLDPADPNFLETLHKKYFPNLPADPSKLAWMAPIPTPGSAADRESPYYPEQDSLPVSALRFDFRGALLPPRTSRAIPVTLGLHHHGEAPEAAGYTIPELARLARSAVPAQRCLAYQTLGRMLYRLGRGDWGTGAAGAPGGDGDDLAFALWRCFQECRVLESLEAEAGLPEGTGHLSCKAYATEALWLFEKGGWREKWRGL